MFAELFFRTGIPFAVIESDALRNFIRAIRPAYASQMPNRKPLSGNLLDETYDELNKKLAVFESVYTIRHKDKKKNFVNWPLSIIG